MSQSKRKKVEKVIKQAKEPLALLQTLKAEGVSRAMQFASIAGSAAKNINLDSAKEQLKATVFQLGFVSKEQLADLEARIEALEEQVEELSGRGSDEE